MSNDLTKISELVYQWKMSFNQEPTKRAQAKLFSHENKRKQTILF